MEFEWNGDQLVSGKEQRGHWVGNVSHDIRRQRWLTHLTEPVAYEVGSGYPTRENAVSALEKHISGWERIFRIVNI